MMKTRITDRFIRNHFKTELTKNEGNSKEQRKIFGKLYPSFYINKATTPLFYGLIKTHKVGLPIRPIASLVNSPSYKLAKYISNILTQITNKADQKLNNSYQIKKN